jgi:hypothetical protein
MKKFLLQERTDSGLYSKSVYRTKKDIEKHYKFNSEQIRDWIIPVFNNYELYFSYNFQCEYGKNKMSCVIKQTFLESSNSIRDIYQYIELAKNLIIDTQKDKNYFWSIIDMRLGSNICYIDNKFILIDESKLQYFGNINQAKVATTRGFYQGIDKLSNLENIDFRKVSEKIIKTVEEIYGV